MSPREWLDAARADAERRGLPQMIPVLEALAAAIARLRADDPDAAWPDSRLPGSPEPR